MANSALTLTTQGPTLDAGFRVRRGYTNLVWERVFGTNATITPGGPGIAVTSMAKAFDLTATGGGGWPYFPEGFPTWRTQRKPGNAEMQFYVDNMNLVSSQQATLGAPWTMGTDHLCMYVRTDCTTDAEVSSCYTQNTDTSTLHNLNSGQTIVCEIPAGLSGFTAGRKLIIGNRDFAIGGPIRGCLATCVSYSGTTLTATSNGPGQHMTTGSYNQLYIIQRRFEAGMWITRTNMPPVLDDCYWEIEQQLPGGAGHWTAHWWIHENIWPPELDGHERFETGNVIRNRVSSAYIPNNSASTITQKGRFHNAWGTDIANGDPKMMDWGTDLTNSYHTYGHEWGKNYIAYVLDDALSRCEFYKWIATRTSAGIPVGAVSFNPRFALNYALGPPLAGYRPNAISFFPGEYKVKYIRIYTKP